MCPKMNRSKIKSKAGPIFFILISLEILTTDTWVGNNYSSHPQTLPHTPSALHEPWLNRLTHHHALPSASPPHLILVGSRVTLILLYAPSPPHALTHLAHPLRGM